MSDAEQVDMGIYDSATGESLEALHVEDISSFQRSYPHVWLVYTEAKAGPIVQLRRGDTLDDAARIHYFYRDQSGQTMIHEDTRRFGFQPGELLALVLSYAPAPTSTDLEHRE